MVSYDASVIEQFAEALYAQAKFIIIRYCVVAGAIGFVVGYLIADGARLRGAEAGIGGLVAVAGLVLGFAAGRARSFTLRLQAQQALCQAQIEKNSRGTSAAARVA